MVFSILLYLVTSYPFNDPKSYPYTIDLGKQLYSEKSLSTKALADDTGYYGSTNNVKYTFIAKSHQITFKGKGPIINLSFPTQPHDSYREEIYSAVIENGITEIGESLFYKCSKLKSVTIPNTVTVIYDSAFENCYQLPSIIIPDSVTKLGDESFYHCSSLSSIQLPNNLLSIGEQVFYSTNLTSISFPKTLASFRSINLGFIPNLQSVDFDAENPYFQTIDGAVFTKNEKKLLYYPPNKKDTTYKIPDGTTMICSLSFNSVNSIEYLYIPDSVLSIENESFFDSKIDTIFIGSGLSILEEDALSYLKNKNFSVSENNSKFKSIDGVLFTKDETGIMIKYPNLLTNETYEIPNTITVIKSYAFDRCNLLNIKIPESVLQIQKNAFYDLKKLRSYNINENNNKYATFNDIIYNKNHSIIIEVPKNKSGNWILHENLLELKENCFYEMSQIKNINIPEKVTKINAKCFQECSQLKSIEIPDSVISIGSEAFYFCKSLQYVLLGNNVAEISERAFASCISLQEIIIPKSLTFLNSETFGYCKSLKSVTICGNIQLIKNNPFASCSELTNFVYNGTIQPEYNSTMFDGCSKLTQVQVLNNYDYNYFCNKKIVKGELGYNKCGENIEWIFNSTSGILNISGFGYMENSSNYRSSFSPIRDLIITVNIDEGINSIGDCSFAQCNELTYIQLPKSLIYIGWAAFEFCKNLISIEIFDNVIEIGPNAFKDCWGLLSVKLSNQLTIIDERLFEKTKSLTNIELSPNIAIIKSWAFYESSLPFIQFPESVIQIEYDAFAKSQLNTINLPDNILTLDKCAFDSCINLSSINIGNGITAVSLGCFRSCSNLTIINFGKNIESIGPNAFSGCEKLEAIILPNKIKVINSSAFSSCKKLQNITIPDCHLEIQNHAFSYCNSITSFDCGENVNYIGDDAFLYCENLESIRFSQCLSYIGESAFYYCHSLISITIPDKVTVINSHAFDGCHNLSKINFGPNIISIESYAFSQNTKLQSLIIPDSVKVINASAFYKCIELSSVILGKNLTKIDNFAFAYTKLVNITIPKNLISIHSGSFSSCEELAYFAVSEDNPMFYSYDGILYTKDDYSIICMPQNKKGHFEFHDNLKKFDEYTYNNYKIVSVTFGKNIEYIRENSFNSCFNLTFVNMGNCVNLHSLSSKCFQNCVKLTTVILPKNLQIFGDNCFDNCIELTTVNYTGLYNLSEYTNSFQNCTKLETINVLENYDFDSFCGINVSKKIIYIPEITSTYIETNTPIITDTPTPVQTSKPQKVTSINITDDINDKQLNTIITDLFDNLGDAEDDEIKVVVINNKNDKNIPFNIDLEQNQYIKLAENSNIDLVGGNLNMILPDNGKAIVLLNNEKENNISIKGNGDLEIKFKAESQSKSINISSNSQINGDVIITVPDKTESLIIDSIDLSSRSSILAKKVNKDNDLNFTVKNITIAQNANASISDLRVQNSLKIYQTGQLNINNVEFDNAIIEYEISNYEITEKWNDSFIKGSFNTPPNSLILKQTNNNLSPKENSKYILISGIFKNNGCEEWLEKVELDNTKFNEKKCEDNIILSDDNKKIVIKASSTQPGYDNNRKNKLSGGAIAGIVIGCVAGVALIAIGVIFAVKKCGHDDISLSP